MAVANDYDQIRDALTRAEDEVIISSYLKRMIVNRESWPEHFIDDVDVFNKNPNKEFFSKSPIFVIVKPRTKNCGKTDECESGCWRIICHDKLIKSKETGKILGFKKIFKFCVKRKPREYKRNWVMEEYRLVNKWNWKQDHVICKIRLLFEAEIGFLIHKHFSYLYTESVELPPTQMMPAYGFLSSCDQQWVDECYLRMIASCGGDEWPDYVMNDVYRLHPLTLVDTQDQMFIDHGIIIFTERKETSVQTDGDCWKIIDSDKLIKTHDGMITGFKRVFQFWETEKKYRYVRELGEDLKVTWTMAEYRLEKDVTLDKLFCVIKLKVLI